ncbi:MAG: hypothetical protein ABH872_00650 [Candidatus Omnitrophota bacterium]
MIKAKKSFLTFFFLIITCQFLLARPLDLPKPHRTEMVSQEAKHLTNMEVTTYFYQSYLSKEEILGFYRKFLVSDGWRETNYSGSNSLKQSSFSFSKTIVNKIVLGFLSSPEKGKSSYFISIQDSLKIPPWPAWIFTKPRNLDFMPVYSVATEFIYNTYFYPMIGAAYLSHSNTKTVKDFYLNEMPKFKWNLVDSQSHDGGYDFFKWLKIVDPFTKQIPFLESKGYDDIIPPLKVEGVTLVFEQPETNCTITIYRFTDILPLSIKSVFDMSFMETHGTTLICVYYFEIK